MRYLELADALRVRLADGEFGSGGALPSESELGAAHGVSRVTVRRALEALRADGLVTSRRGSGWFVAHDPVRQPLGRITTVEATLEAAGAVPERRVLEFAFERASVHPRVASVLAVEPADEVLRVLRLNLADGAPFALVTVFVSGEVGRHISRAEVEIATFYDLLPIRGVELGRVQQVIGAAVATSHDALHLDVEPGAAILTATRTTSSVDGRRVIYSLHRYPAERTAMEIELPSLSFDPTARVGVAESLAERA